MIADIKKELADEAVRIVTGARRAAYGSPESNFQRIADFWMMYFRAKGWTIANIDVGEGPGQSLDVRLRSWDNKILPRDVAAMMRLMKEARLAETPDHRDSFVDLVGYALCGAEVAGVEPKAGELEVVDCALCGPAARAEPAPAPAPEVKHKHKFKVGDKVRVLPGTVGRALHYIGEVVEIVAIDRDGDLRFVDYKGDEPGHRTFLFPRECKLVEPAPGADGWIAWEGGKMPVPSDARVIARLRSGFETTERAADTFYWSHGIGGADIVAYRVVKS